MYGRRMEGEGGWLLLQIEVTSYVSLSLITFSLQRGWKEMASGRKHASFRHRSQSDNGVIIELSRLGLSGSSAWGCCVAGVAVLCSGRTCRGEGKGLCRCLAGPSALSRPSSGRSAVRCILTLAYGNMDLHSRSAFSFLRRSISGWRRVLSPVFFWKGGVRPTMWDFIPGGGGAAKACG